MAHPPSSLLLILLLLLHLPPSLQQNINPADLSALRSIKDTLTDIPTRGPGGHFFSSWNFDAPDPCSSFAGVSCSLGRVTVLSLGTGLSGSLGLAGSLPAAISELTELSQLILFPGIVTGPIPPQLGKLRNLRVISLPKNRLTGSIPDDLSSLFSLHTIDLSHNLLTGRIPASLTQLPELKVLILASNQLSGDLPDISSQLFHLDLKSNKLSGTIPTSLPSSLRYLSLSENAMWGQLTNGLESLTELVYVDLSMNHFSGPIPSSLFRPTLSSLLLQRNYLTGGVPLTLYVAPTEASSGPTLSSYGEGSTVDLSHNYISGELSEILAGVETLFLNNNRLIGAVPEAYVLSVYSGRTTTLYIQHNYISGFPLELGLVFPDTASLCLSYNCMEPPAGVSSCPASSGSLLSRPAWQCAVIKNISSNTHIP